jgi:hypothetical protein
MGRACKQARHSRCRTQPVSGREAAPASKAQQVHNVASLYSNLLCHWKKARPDSVPLLQWHITIGHLRCYGCSCWSCHCACALAAGGAPLAAFSVWQGSCRCSICSSRLAQPQQLHEGRVVPCWCPTR